MKKATIIACLLILVFVSAAQAQTKTNRCTGTNGLTLSEIGSILEAHNKIRTELGLSKLEWNCDLANFAQEWATRGIFEHRTDANYGENIFAAMDTKISPVKAVELWQTEKTFWNNASGTCQTGKFCGHFTQMVWRNTTEIGCGINRNASGKWKVLMVCNYNPAGNFEGKAY